MKSHICQMVLETRVQLGGLKIDRPLYVFFFFFFPIL